MIDLVVNKKTVEYLAIAAIGIYLIMQINGMTLLEATSQTYTTFYYRTLMTGLGGIFIMVVFGVWYFTINPLQLGWKTSVLIIALYTVFIAALSYSGNQIWPVPSAFSNPMSMSPLENYITSSLIPGFSEDLLYLCVFPMILILLYSLAKLLILGGIEIDRIEFMIVAFIACGIASTGYGIWVIPGFTSSHVPAYGGAQLAYAGAWIFSFGQSLIYLITGIFAPLAHIIHNIIITNQQLYAVSVAIPMLVIPKQHLNKNKFVYMGGILMIMMLLVSGCLSACNTAGECLDSAINRTGEVTGTLYNRTRGLFG